MQLPFQQNQYFIQFAPLVTLSPTSFINEYNIISPFPERSYDASFALLLGSALHQVIQDALCQNQDSMINEKQIHDYIVEFLIQGYFDIILQNLIVQSPQYQTNNYSMNQIVYNTKQTLCILKNLLSGCKQIENEKHINNYMLKLQGKIDIYSPNAIFELKTSTSRSKQKQHLVQLMFYVFNEYHDQQAEQLFFDIVGIMNKNDDQLNTFQYSRFSLKKYFLNDLFNEQLIQQIYYELINQRNLTVLFLQNVEQIYLQKQSQIQDINLKQSYLLIEELFQLALNEQQNQNKLQDYHCQLSKNLIQQFNIQFQFQTCSITNQFKFQNNQIITIQNLESIEVKSGTSKYIYRITTAFKSQLENINLRCCVLVDGCVHQTNIFVYLYILDNVKYIKTSFQINLLKPQQLVIQYICNEVYQLTSYKLYYNNQKYYSQFFSSSVQQNSQQHEECYINYILSQLNKPVIVISNSNYNTITNFRQLIISEVQSKIQLNLDQELNQQLDTAFQEALSSILQYCQVVQVCYDTFSNYGKGIMQLIDIQQQESNIESCQDFKLQIMQEFELSNIAQLQIQQNSKLNNDYMLNFGDLIHSQQSESYNSSQINQQHNSNQVQNVQIILINPDCSNFKSERWLNSLTCNCLFAFSDQQLYSQFLTFWDQFVGDQVYI